MNEGDPRPNPTGMSDEDLLVELGVAVGSLTALEMALARGTVKAESKSFVEAGCREWARRVDRLHAEVETRGFSIVVVEPWERGWSRRAEQG